MVLRIDRSGVVAEGRGGKPELISFKCYYINKNHASQKLDKER